MGICVSRPLRQKASPHQSLHFKTALVVYAALRYIAYVCLWVCGVSGCLIVFSLLSSLSPLFLVLASS